MFRLPLIALFLCLTCVLAAEDAVTATLAKRGNVRYGPNKAAGIAVTLQSGAQVTIIGKIRSGNETWYQVRFPREGKAWMHMKTLKDRGDGSYDVVEDKARMREDATAGANILAELALGDVVESRSNRVGDWLAVYSPKAVAYVSEVVLDLKPEVVQQVQAGAVAERSADRMWKVAKETYTRFAATKETQQALVLDWPGLSRQLGEVVQRHGSMSVRIEAQRYQDGVDAVAREQTRLGAKPATPVPEPGPEPVETAPAPQNPPVATLPPNDSSTSAPKPEQPAVVVSAPVAAPSPEVQQLMGEQANKVTQVVGGFAVEGYLEQRGESYVVFDNTSTVLAVLKPNGQINLSEYFWRKVGVKGSSQGTADDGAGTQVQVILVEDLQLLEP